MKTWTRLRTAALALPLAAAIGAAPTSSASAGGLLKMAEADWTGGIVTCRLIEHIVKDWGFKVKRIVMPSGPAVMEAMRNGDIDYACESWPSYSTTKDKFIKKWGGDGSVAYLGDMGVIGQSGYYVPRYMIEGDAKRNIKATTPDLKTYSDLNKYKDVFKTLETGSQGKLLGCPVAAWQCKDAERLKALGIDFRAVELGAEAAHWAEIQAAYKRGEPFLAYTWEPHWIHAELDLVEVKLPPHSKEKWPATDWPLDPPYNYGSPAFVKKHPKVAALLTNMNLSNSEQAKMIYRVDIKKEKLDDVVKDWLKNNEAIWKKWAAGGS